jgi:SAM-dependent methyltransferase
VISDSNDAYGHAILDYFEGRNHEQAASAGCRVYFSEYDDWFEREKKAVCLAKGKVLDIGCAAGRHALYLQERGHQVVAIDNSPLAIDVCRRRGVRDARLLSVTNLSFRLGVFDTILMLGNNFGLLGNRRRARWLLRRFKRMSPPDGIILAGDGYAREAFKGELAEQVAENTRRRRLPGEVVIRKRYRHYLSAPIQWLYASPEHMREVLDGTGWVLDDVIEDGTSAFVGVVRKQGPNKTAAGDA